MLGWLQTLVPVADLYDLEISRLTDVRSSPPPYDKPNESPVIGGYGFELHETRAFQTTQKHIAVGYGGGKRHKSFSGGGSGLYQDDEMKEEDAFVEQDDAVSGPEEEAGEQESEVESPVAASPPPVGKDITPPPDAKAASPPPPVAASSPPPPVAASSPPPPVAASSPPPPVAASSPPPPQVLKVLSSSSSFAVEDVSSVDLASFKAGVVEAVSESAGGAEVEAVLLVRIVSTYTFPAGLACATILEAYAASVGVDAANIESDCVDARRSLRARTMLQEGQEVEFIVDIPEEEAAVATTVASQVRGIVWLENRGPREMRFDS